MKQQHDTHRRLWRLCRRPLLLLALLLGVAGMKADEPVDSVVDENFVVASIIVADPGDVLYSTVGHVAIHMECPEHKLDYVFSYETEDVRDKVLTFLAGKLRMGMAAMSIEEYLNYFHAQGRGVKEYRLNMPVEAKRNLWRMLDNRLLEGPNLSYDYMKRGCAHSTLSILKEGLDTIPLTYGPWPETFKLTRRELTKIQLKEDYPWVCCFMNLICNGEIDRSCSNEQKVIMPADLIAVLQRATVDGKPLLSESYTTLLPSQREHRVPWCTPFLVSVVLLLLTLLCVCLSSSVMDYVLLALQTLLGIVTVYLIFFSNLCCTEWSWLIIPFNPLPLVLWKWRYGWCLPYALILVVWAIVVSLWPHMLTDKAYIVLSVALAVSYCGMFLQVKKRKYEKS